MMILAGLSIKILAMIVGLAQLRALPIRELEVGNSTTLVRNYDGYKVLSIKIDTPDQLEYLNEKFDALVALTATSDDRVDAIVAPAMIEELRTGLLENRMSFEIVDEDLGVSLREEQSTTSLGHDDRQSSNANNSFAFKYNRFPRYGEIVKYMENLSRNYSDVYVVTIGFTDAPNSTPIQGMVISGALKKPVFFVDAGIHAREWAAPVSALYAIEEILKSEEMRRAMNYFIVPCLNPDGYEYTHTTDRFWRKNRARNKNSNCMGVDLNRNFDSHWAEIGASRNPCSEVYRGEKPFSEAEARALKNIILLQKPYAYVTLHSYGTLILYPWGFTKRLPKNWRSLHSIAQAASNAARAVGGPKYTIGSSRNVLYGASGGSDDWAMEKGNTSIVFTIELPAYKRNSFIVPASKISLMVKQTYAALRSFVHSINNTNYKP